LILRKCQRKNQLQFKKIEAAAFASTMTEQPINQYKNDDGAKTTTTQFAGSVSCYQRS
jgi:hypothetical protein